MEHQVVADLAICIVAAWIFGVVAQVFRQPLLLGYLLAGFVIGPVGTGMIKERHSIETISSLGLILLLFLIGLEIDLKKNAKVKYVVLEEFIRLGQRISRFNIEKWENGRWIKVADATTIGHKRILKLDNVQTEKIRVNILSSKACPLISGISVY